LTASGRFPLGLPPLGIDMKGKKLNLFARSTRKFCRHRFDARLKNSPSSPLMMLVINENDSFDRSFSSQPPSNPAKRGFRLAWSSFHVRRPPGYPKRTAFWTKTFTFSLCNWDRVGGLPFFFFDAYFFYLFRSVRAPLQLLPGNSGASAVSPLQALLFYERF